MKMYRKVFLGFIGVAIASLIFSGQVQAASATSIWFTGQNNQSSDNDAEFLVNKIDPATGLPFADTTLDVGDVFVTVSNFFSNEDLTGGGGTLLYGAGGVNELTVLALTEVASKVATPGGAPGTFDFTFSPLTATGIAAIGAHPGLAPIAAEQATWAAGSMVAAFDDALLDYTRLGSPDDGGPVADVGVGPFVMEGAVAGTAMNGTKILELGFTGAAGEGWVVLGALDDISLFRSLVPSGSTVGAFSFGTNITADFLPLWQFGTVLNPLTIGGSSQFAGSGSLIGLALSGGGSILTPFDAFSNLDVTFAPIFVPEPSTLTLWSLGALALAGIGWRRRNRVR